MKKNTTTKIVALIALLAILIWVLGTGINFVLNMWENANNAEEVQLTPEQLEEIKNNLNKQIEEGKINLEDENTENSENNTEEPEALENGARIH
jgi:sensor domain CHASE-containing protein